jgi:hypothetical protein
MVYNWDKSEAEISGAMCILTNKTNYDIFYRAGGRVSFS